MRALLLALFLLPIACGGGVDLVASIAGSGFEAIGGPPGMGGERPAAAPDYVVLSVSGRNFEFSLFCPPECNVAYIDDEGSAAEAVILDLIGRGHTVESETYIAALSNYDDDGDGAFDERLGFLQLVQDLEWVHENWIDGFTNPTKIVMICHSHGCVWGHIATSVVPDITIDVLISMDGVCTLWEFDHEDQIRGYYDSVGGNPFPWDISAPCFQWDVLGIGRFDTEDVAFDNVVFNIEVRANGELVAQDGTANFRLDGTRDDIVDFQSGDDDHSEVLDPNRGSMQFVLAQLALVTPAAP